MKNNPRSNIPDFATLILWIAASLMLAWLAYAGGGVDFNVYYAAARVTLNGGNPYDYCQLAAEIVSVTEINNPYYYLPWFTWSMSPLAMLPYQIARGLWSLINVALWFFALLNLQKILDWPPAGWKRWSVYLLVTVLFAWTTWGFEQVGILILFLLTLSLLALKKENWLTAGIWFALLLFKPNITALPIASILLWFILKRNWRPAFATGLSTLLLLSASFLLTPNWLQTLLTPDKLMGLSYKFDESGGLDLIRYNTTLKDWLAVYNVGGTLATVIYAAVAVSGLGILGWTVFRSTSLAQVTAIALLVAFAITPYALYYDYPALTLTLFHANDVALSKPALKWTRFALNALALFSLFVGTTISYRYWTTITIAAVMAFRYAAAKTDSQVGLPV
ncbi:MAG: glycosyltransferase family 87 protein [Chloroflexota bacterium]